MTDQVKVAANAVVLIPSTMVSAQDKVLHLSLLTCTDRQISRPRLYSHRLLVFRTEVKRCLFTYHSPLSS